MAAVCLVPLPPPLPLLKSLRPNAVRRQLSPIFVVPSSLGSTRTRSPTSAASSSSTSTATASAIQDDQKASEEAMNIHALRRFIDLNLGNWTGSFHQFDPDGNLLHKVTTKLAASSYGEDDLVSLIQSLYIKQPQSTTSISGDTYEPEWAEYKIKETNMFTVDKYQQIGFFPSQKAFALRYQTAGMLETVLRQGVLGEDDIGEVSPKNLKLPSRQPAIVCENCLYSLQKDMRARAFHIMDPKGIIEMFLIFLEERGGAVIIPPSFDSSMDSTSRIIQHLGKWKGHSITKRSGVYGATIAEANTTAVLEIDNKGHLIQDITSTFSGDVTTNVHWTGSISNNLVKFDGGFQVTLLPGSMYMGCPSDVAKSVAESKPFHLEFCWLESPGKRQRLVRTYDVEGLAVSSTYFFETKILAIWAGLNRCLAVVGNLAGALLCRLWLHVKVGDEAVGGFI
ncbi:uncharacterized protein LOC127803574 [Diospyros lotus]|uniref:uncharacterized protein LOC127803574 n=1 Tax=Diospyros lotus TaxID=55363 RepID=UPI002251A6AD|nr:uncharacterized protein LOC127803574 [Diospyros lotus]